MPAPMSAGIDRKFEQTLAALINSGEPEIIQGGRKGVEKESLRVTPDGHIAQTPHPRALGSALTHENITTDYSEALIELVSPTFRTSWELLQYLLDLHQFVYQHIGDELLWATSMPSIIDGDASIPDRAVRQVEHRPHENRVPRRLGRALRPRHAGHLRRALQLLVPRAHVGRVAGHRAVAHARPGFHLGPLFPPAAQLPPPRLDRALSVRRVAGGLQFVPARPQRHAATPLEATPRTSRMPPPCA